MAADRWARGALPPKSGATGGHAAARQYSTPVHCSPCCYCDTCGSFLVSARLFGPPRLRMGPHLFTAAAATSEYDVGFSVQEFGRLLCRIHP